MKNLKKILSVLLVLAMVLSVMAGCGKSDNDPSATDPTNGTAGGETAAYSVKVKNAGGRAMKGLTVYVFRDQALTDMVDFGETDADGNVSFNLATGVDYYVTVEGVGKGYDYADLFCYHQPIFVRGTVPASR